MELTFLGHACFVLDDGTSKVLTDPFLTGNPLAAAKAEDVEADMLFVTHGHGDHVGDSVAIARRTGAPVCCTADLAEQVFGPAGVETVDYSTGRESWFEFLPAPTPGTLRPALVAGEQVVKKGLASR